jgi:hypothetical protein
MLNQQQYNQLWQQHFAPLTNSLNPPNYNEYYISDRMFEDYLDIFRGVNTRTPHDNHIMPYGHPYFINNTPILPNAPCIKYVMIGEARPSNPGTYFYNINDIGQTAWLREPYKAFYTNSNWVHPKSPQLKVDVLLQLAKAGYILLDLFPYAIKYSTPQRQIINNNGVSSFFFNNSINGMLAYLVKYTNKINNTLPIVAFSGPPKIHHFLAYSIGNLTLVLNPNFRTFAIPNFLNPNPMTGIPPIEIGWQPNNILLNGKYNNYPNLYNGIGIPLNRAPFYRCCTYRRKALYEPEALFIANAFDL